MSLHTISIDNSQSESIPVVFLHGFGGVGAQWWGLQTATSFKTPTYAFDLPGHGKSVNYPEAGPPKTAANAVLSELESRGVKKAHFVGHSMGGAIASLAALVAPQMVASLTLLAPGGYGTEFNHPLLLKWAAAKTREELADVLPSFFDPTYEMHPKIVEFQLDTRSQTGVVDSLISIADGMSSDGKQGMLPVDEVLAGDYPISVVWGKNDLVLPVSQARALEGRVDLHIVDGVGHSPAEEAAELVKSLILARL